jgi:GNAT superfamily N-acetyltransferase
MFRGVPVRIADLIASVDALVATDAGRYDPAGTDLDWAERGGSAYATSILHAPGIVHPVRVAELESLHVYPEHRGRGVGEQLVAAFLAWAAGRGAQRASVAAYAANEGAQRFYARHGFVPRSVVLHRDDLS